MYERVCAGLALAASYWKCDNPPASAEPDEAASEEASVSALIDDQDAAVLAALAVRCHRPSYVDRHRRPER